MIYFLFCREFQLFLREWWKNTFFSSRFRESWNFNLKTDMFNRFLLEGTTFVQETTFVRLSKENLFCLMNAPKIHIFNSWRHQKLLLVAKQLQVSTFLFEIISESIAISKLVSQLKLLASLFELRDNDTIAKSTISKKICHELEAC